MPTPSRIYSRYFSDNYLAARQRFLEAARSRGATLFELPLDVRSPETHALSIDIACIGSASPARALVHSSGLHGVEGFAGSAIQLALLDRLPVLPPDAALVFVHVLNPYGMAWLRRTNEHNVDLNRNFFGADAQRPETSADYRFLNPLLNPPSPPATDLFYARMVYLAWRWGVGRLKQGIVEGQYEFPDGLFYGGDHLEQGPALYQAWLKDNLSSLQRGFAIDVHTGLGRYARESLFLRRAPQAAAGALSERFGRPFLSDAKADGVGYDLRGGYAGCFDVLPATCDLYAVTQEFGTYPALSVLHALREENRWHRWGAGSILHPVKTRFKEMFAPDEPEWRESVVGKGVSLAQTACEYLFDPAG